MEEHWHIDVYNQTVLTKLVKYLDPYKNTSQEDPAVQTVFQKFERCRMVLTKKMK